jgi:hypothetical protein
MIVRVIYLSAPSGAIVSAYLAHGVHGDERRFRGDREQDDVFAGHRLARQNSRAQEPTRASWPGLRRSRKPHLQAG